MIRSATSLKSIFKTGALLSAQNFSDFVDSSFRIVNLEIANSAESGSTGIVNVSGDINLSNTGTVGLAIVGAAATASAYNQLGAGAMGTSLLMTATTGAASSLLNFTGASAPSAFSDIADVSVLSAASGAILRDVGGQWQSTTTPDSAWFATTAQTVSVNSSLLLNPSLMGNHPGICVAWALVSLSPNVSAHQILANYNASKVVIVNTSTWRIDYDKPVGTDNGYCAVGTYGYPITGTVASTNTHSICIVAASASSTSFSLQSASNASISGPMRASIMVWGNMVRNPIQTLIGQATGTPLGDMTINGGLAASFDGVTNQGATSCSRSNNSSGYIGKDWGATKTITGFKAWGSSDFGFDELLTSSNITITIQGSNDNFVTDIQNLGTVGPTADALGSQMQMLSGITPSACRYVRLHITTDTGSTTVMYCAEAQFYETI